MDIKLSTISNGLRVITTEMPNTISASVKILVGTGARHEKDFEPGVSHALEHQVFRSTKTRTSKEIMQEIEILGGYNNAYTSKEATVYYANGLSTSVPKFMEIIGDITSNALHKQEDIDIEKKVILQEIAMYKGLVDDLSYDNYYRAAYGSHPMGLPILGTEEFISTLQHDSILRYVNEHYFAGNMVLSVAGNVQHDAIVALAEKYFSSIPEKGVRNIVGKPVYLSTEHSTVDDFDQMSVVLGLSPNDDMSKRSKIAHKLAAIALGGGSCSLLSQEIREKRGLVYSTWSHYNAHTDDHAILLGAGFTPENLDEIINCFSDVVSRANVLVSDDDIQRAKNTCAVQLSGLVEKPDAISSHVGYLILDGEELEIPKDTISRVIDFNDSDVRAVLENLKNYTVAVGAAGPIENPNIIDRFKEKLQ